MREEHRTTKDEPMPLDRQTVHMTGPKAQFKYETAITLSGFWRHCNTSDWSVIHWLSHLRLHSAIWSAGGRGEGAGKELEKSQGLAYGKVATNPNIYMRLKTLCW